MVLYPVMFDLQGRRGSGGQQGLAGTPGAAVRIEMKKKPMRLNILLSYIGSTGLLDIKFHTELLSPIENFD